MITRDAFPVAVGTVPNAAANAPVRVNAAADELTNSRRVIRNDGLLVPGPEILKPDRSWHQLFTLA